MSSGDIITIKPYDGVIVNDKGEQISSFELTPFTMADEVRAGGRIPLIIGRSLTDKTREALGLFTSCYC